MVPNLSKVNDISPWLGCDPEFFFRKGGQVIGAEKFIPAEGLTNKVNRNLGTFMASAPASKFIIDGVQAELNPRPNTCRANLANEIAACFSTLKTELDARGDGIAVDFSRTVNITEEKLNELDEKSRKFGCAPSLNIYKQQTGLKITDVDPAKYMTRAAGGHIHIGTGNYAQLTKALTTDHEKTVAMLDLLCGNTSVLVDRDEGNIERRKVYGKAGEFRLPSHGLEYRTLSNYWLTAYPLMSFAFGLARLAVQLIADVNNSAAYYDAFMSKVKTKDIHDAINNNDFDLAMSNFLKLEPLLLEVTWANSRYPIHVGNITQFKHFVSKVKSDGLSYWFKQDPMTHWTNLPEGHQGGFYDFSLGAVATDMLTAKGA